MSTVAGGAPPPAHARRPPRLTLPGAPPPNPPATSAVPTPQYQLCDSAARPVDRGGTQSAPPNGISSSLAQPALEIHRKTKRNFMFGGSSHHSTSPQEEAEALVSLMDEFSSRDQAAFNFSVCERGCTCVMRRRVVLLAILLLLTAAGVTAQAAVVSQAVDANSRTEEGQTVGTGGAPFGPATLAPAPRKQEQLAYLQDAYLDDDYDDYEDDDLEQPSQDSSGWGRKSRDRVRHAIAVPARGLSLFRRCFAGAGTAPPRKQPSRGPLPARRPTAPASCT